MKFRAACHDDIAAMTEIRLSVTENTLSNPDIVTRQMYEEFLHEKGRGWVCEIDRHVIGFSYADMTNHSIWALFVAPGYEGRGIGRGLLRLAVDFLFAHGAMRVTLSTAAHTRADRFYTAQGWVRGDMKNTIEVAYHLDNPGAIPALIEFP